MQISQLQESLTARFGRLVAALSPGKVKASTYICMGGDVCRGSATLIDKAMSYDEHDAAEDAFYERMYKELGPQWAEENGLTRFEDAVEEFAADRMRSYYVEKPGLAGPANNALAYAISLRSSHPQAALIFATSSIELAIKTVLLQPIVYGLVHSEELAPLIAELAVGQNGFDRFRHLLNKILQEYGAVDLESLYRSNSSTLLRLEIEQVQKARNRVLHRGEFAPESESDLAIAIATLLLFEVFPQVLRQLGLHHHESLMVCDKSHNDARKEPRYTDLLRKAFDRK